MNAGPGCRRRLDAFARGNESESDAGDLSEAIEVIEHER
jgi:hypothetical protein